jgi:hypothetical protein
MAMSDKKKGALLMLGTGAVAAATRGIITVENLGDFGPTFDFLNKALTRSYLGNLDQVGYQGVVALKNATPVDTGGTANAWYYKVERNGDSATVSWHNDKLAGTAPLAIMLQYGHGTGSGGYVQGRDYINPALQPIFDRLAANAWTDLTGK